MKQQELVDILVNGLQRIGLRRKQRQHKSHRTERDYSGIPLFVVTGLINYLFNTLFAQYIYRYSQTSYFMNSINQALKVYECTLFVVI